MLQEKEKKTLDKEENLKNNTPVNNNEEVKEDDLGKVSGGSYKPFDDKPYWTNTPF